MGRGIENIPDFTGGGGQGSTRHLRLRDDQESARIRFLTEGDEILFETFHRLPGQGNSKFGGFKICVADALDQPCDLCERMTGDNYGRQTLMMAWVYEYYHDYPEKPSGDRAPKTEAVRVGRNTLYREEIGEARILKIAAAHKGAFNLRWGKYGTLLDRDYDFVRMGVRGTTRPQYVLEPEDASPMPPELAKLASELPDLEDYAFDRLEDAPKVEERKPTVKASRPAPRPRSAEDEGSTTDDDTDRPF